MNARTPVSAHGMAHAALNIGRWAALAACLWTLLLARSQVPPYVIGGTLAASAGLLLLLERRRAASGTAALYLVGFVLWAHLRRFGDETGVPWQYGYVIALERALTGGIPTVWLQERLYTPGTAGALDAAMTAVYLSYFLVPHLTALLLWRCGAAVFRQYVYAVLITAYLGLAVCYAVPTAPPWLAAQAGEIPPVTRIVPELAGGQEAAAYREGHELAGVNPVAAMPSLHMALTVLVAAAAWRLRRAAGVAGAGYAAAMGFALVYLGDHYTADVLAGALSAAAAWTAAGVLASRRGRAGGP